MRYILNENDIKYVSHKYLITSERVRQLVSRINSIKSGPALSLFSELDKILHTDPQEYRNLQREYEYRP